MIDPVHCEADHKRDTRWLCLMTLGFLIVAFVGVSVHSATAQHVGRSIRLTVSQQVQVVSKDELWNHPLAKTEVMKFPGYYKDQSLRVRMLPLQSWIESRAKNPINDKELSLRSLDGFQVPISVVALGREDQRGGPVAYISIEPSEGDLKQTFDRWPLIEKGPGRGATAGPFAVIWKGATGQMIGPEQWPYQVVEMQIVDSVETRFPMTAPRSDASSQVHLGFRVFKKNCISCHSLNLQGGAHIGPDLNWPQSPTEYFQRSKLRSFLRNPSSLRHWENSSMPGFSQEVIPDFELDALLTYFSHMAPIRPSVRPEPLPKAQPNSKQK